MEDHIWQSARQQLELLQRGDICAVDLMNAYYDRIEAINPGLNALVNLLPREDAVALARESDATTATSASAGALHGLPMACKDLVDVKGFPTTFGFVPWANRLATRDSPVVARQRAAGALFIGKTNMPEFGLGSHTFNSLFGTTRNPYEPTVSAGGSSGGAAAALASGMLAIADGSDMGGSLRNPASFCNVVGFRPSIGRVPDDRPLGWFGRLATVGPMARNVADAALLLSVQAGPSLDDPLTLEDAGSRFRSPAEKSLDGLKVAFSPDLGHVPVDPEVVEICSAAARVFEDLGATVEPACPDLSRAMEVFQVQRAAVLAATGRALDASLPDWRKHAKDTVIWNIEQGFALTAEELIASEVLRTSIYRDVCGFFDHYDVLLLPAAQVPPFPAQMSWVEEINGQRMETYIDWMTVCCAISVTGLPAISVPAGFTPAGLPVGLQIVGGPRQDLALLETALAFESATSHASRRPDPARLAG